MNVQQALQDLNNRLDKCRRKLAAAELREDEVIARQFKREIQQIEKELASTKELKQRQVVSKAASIKAFPFNRALTKAEQADMGKLKKAAKGLVVVHPMTALGREMGVAVVTGFAPKAF
ncbi:YibL family ribosome-associated protein [Marinagarivorans cellulosilyticus]|uniref:Ribosome-associated protein n=1 Tax=Marinagarivorans cellulosilyticus TaxID=2721545 RepID=A0AAN1WFC7_9GAMM|nr:YibL family ribosome-associated protein [Marinagarivorans cellulosilyticus]BCD96565.1 ribosome-associated protein [Marinagarivorans cellulosilyticus]